MTAEWDRPNWGPVLPPTEVPSLLDEDGELPKTVGEFAERDLDRDEVVAEMDAQVERLREVGFEPDYVDVHMAVQRRVDWLADAVTELCEREGLIDGTDVTPIPGAGGVGTGPDWLLDALDGVDPGTYIVVGHPVYETEETVAITGMDNERGEVAANRVAQRQLFTDDRVLEHVENHDVEAIRYDEV